MTQDPVPRLAYADAGRLARSVLFRARELGVRGNEFITLTAVVQLTGLYSKAADRTYRHQIASLVYGEVPAQDWQAKAVRKHLKTLAERGLIRRVPPRPGVRAGRNYFVELLPQSGTPWTDDGIWATGAQKEAANEKSTTAGEDAVGSEVPTTGGQHDTPPGGQDNTPLGGAMDTPYLEDDREDAPTTLHDDVGVGEDQAAVDLIAQTRPPSDGQDGRFVRQVAHLLEVESNRAVRYALLESHTFGASVPALHSAVRIVRPVVWLDDDQFARVLRRRGDFGSSASLSDVANRLGFEYHDEDSQVHRLHQIMRWELDEDLAPEHASEIRQRLHSAYPSNWRRALALVHEHDLQIWSRLLERYESETGQRVTLFRDDHH